MYGVPRSESFSNSIPAEAGTHELEGVFFLFFFLISLAPRFGLQGVVFWNHGREGETTRQRIFFSFCSLPHLPSLRGKNVGILQADKPWGPGNIRVLTFGDGLEAVTI